MIVGKINSCLGSKKGCGSLVSDISLISSGEELWARITSSESVVSINGECLMTDGSIG